MKKSELRKEILSAFTQEEWAALASERTAAPVSRFNREMLLDLREREDFPGEADDEKVRALRETVESYLREQWAEEPGAHKYVVAVCLVMTFLYEKPMHPPEKALYRCLVRDGKARYFCPAREPGEGSVCEFCLSEPMSTLEEGWEALIADTARREGEASARVQREVVRAGFQDSGTVKTSALRFHEEVRATCEGNRCRGYGSSWACPPAVGSLEECRERVLGFEKLQLFSKAYLLSDSMDFSSMGSAMLDFKECAWALGKQLRPRLKRLLILSNEGCMRCKTCTWPEEACRFPEELQPSIEGFGFIVSELAKQAGIPYMNGKSTVTFFGAVLFDENGLLSQEE